MCLRITELKLVKSCLIKDLILVKKVICESGKKKLKGNEKKNGKERILRVGLKL